MKSHLNRTTETCGDINYLYLSVDGDRAYLQLYRAKKVVSWGKVTEAVTLGKSTCNSYGTNVSAFMLIGEARSLTIAKKFRLELESELGSENSMLFKLFIH